MSSRDSKVEKEGVTGGKRGVKGIARWKRRGHRGWSLKVLSIIEILTN